MTPLSKPTLFSLISGALALFAATRAVAAENCVLTRVAQLPMSISSLGIPTVPVTVDGHQLIMAVDTVMGVSVLSKAASLELGLETHKLRRIIINNAYNARFDMSVLARNVKIGSLNADAMEFAYQNGSVGAGLDGILSADFLDHYDVEFDFAGAALSLYLPDHCPHQFAQWTTGGYATVDAKIDPVGIIRFPVQLDGKEVQAVLATGFASSSLEFERAAYLFDLDQSDPNLTRLPNSNQAIQYYRYPFKTLSFQGVTVTHPNIELIARPKQDVMLNPRSLGLGLDVLRRLHLYISYAEHTIYMTSATAH